jgi:myo-inositol 2-dehydrogenase / D-chiro-inositol 1-dehydrogenase
MFMDMTIHDFDMARYLMNSEDVEVFVQGAVLVDPVFAKYEDVDTAFISCFLSKSWNASLVYCVHPVWW